nr:hypothetical protein [Mangrovihabitans endophyticus]
MAARAGARGLDEGDLQAIRESLAAKRRPKVQFTESAGQISGQVGQVVALLDPAESDEWVVVRFGRDELPFSPGDVRIAPKGAAARKPAAAEPAAAPEAAPPPPEPEFVIDKPAPVREEPAAPAGSSPTGSGAAPPPAPRKPARAAGKPAAKPKSPALTVTLAYTEGEWTVAAAQGSKALAKPYVIKPAEALRMVALVDVPGVQEAVDQIMAAERSQAEQEADRLRAQLAEVEARLAELTEPA